jgi:putative endopeptidase
MYKQMSTQTKKINPINKKNKTCKTSNPGKTYEPFEKKVKQMFRDQHIDYESVNYDLTKQLLKDLKRATNPKGVKANDDYYSYINDRWLNNKFDTENFKYLVQYDDFRIIQDKVFKELLVITDDFLTSKIVIPNHATYEAKLRNDMINFLGSLNNFVDRENSTNVVVKYVLKVNDLCKDKKNIWKMLALLNNNEIISWGAPFVWKVNPDDRNPKVYKTFMGSGKLTLSDITLYFDFGDKKTAYSQNYIKQYKSYLKDLFLLSLGEHHKYDPNHVYECEKLMANALICTTDIHQDPDYNLITKAESKSKYGFDWEQFTTALGYKTVPPDFVCSSPVYLFCMTRLLLSDWTSQQWQTYYIYLYIRQIERWSEKGRALMFNFHHKFVQGQVVQTPNNILNIFPLGFAFPNFYNNEYIKRFNNKEVISFSKAMADDLKEVFIRIIKRNKWLEPATKEKALQKLEKFKISVGSDLTGKFDPIFNHNSKFPWQNLLAVAHWRKSKFIKLDGHATQNIPMIDWSQYPAKFLGKQSFVVNAMYTPSENAIDVPLGYLQKPFVDLEERGIEYNLAHIGFTFGHEMSHSLDDWGSKYNALGQLQNWWTDKDRVNFKKIQADVIKQYEAFALNDGIKFDASLSIGEDLADISGLSICVEYLRDFQLKNQDILPIKKLSFQVFWVYFAFQQRQKLKKQAIKAQLLTNPHPLDKYRTNVPLSRLEVFREMYNVKKGDKMWWPSTDKVWQ